MSSRTRIVVLHMKEIVYTLIFAVLAIIMLILLFIMFRSKQTEQGNVQTQTTASLYVPGVYSTTVDLHDSSFDVQVRVDKDHINSIELVNMNETVQTMYPLVESALDELSVQILKTQSTKGLTCRADTRYTSALLVHAIEAALEKAEK